MAKLFGKKTPAEQRAAEPPSHAPKFDPAKAQRWFEHGSTMHESGNFEYAATCWLKGLSFAPAGIDSMSVPDVLERLYVSGSSFASGQKKPGPSKEQLKSFDAKSALGKFLLSLLHSATRPEDVATGVKAVEASAALHESEVAEWIGTRTIAIAVQQGDVKKDQMLRLKDALVKVSIFRVATKAGELALQLDPSDASLQAEVRNLGAQSAMHAGGYDSTDKEGGFRKNIRDADTQRKLQEEEQLSKSADTADRVVAGVKEVYEEFPEDPHAASKYARVLLERGADGDEATAERVLQEAYERTGEFRYRQGAGDIALRRGKRALAAAKKSLEATPKDEALQAAYKSAYSAQLRAEADEYASRAAAYPTDLGLKYELGRRLFRLGDYDGAIAALQEAQSDAKHRVRVMHYLAQSFGALEWRDEAIGMFRDALAAHPVESDELGMALRYGLMRALRAKGEEDRDLDAVQEAIKLASAIAMRQINFRDIRTQRSALQELSKELRDA